MLIPLYGFVPGDTLGVLVLVQGDDTVQALAASLAKAVKVRVAISGNLAIRRGDRVLDSASTVGSVGLQPLDRVDLVLEDG